jgi:sortase A
MSTFRRTVDIFGRFLIGFGVVLLLFTTYQIWGTSVQESRTQSGLRTQLHQETNNDAIRKALPQESAPDTLPNGPPVAAPRTNPPAEGSPIRDIRIAVIGLNQIVVEGTNTPDLRKGPGHFTGTPMPGEAGNFAVAGHRATYGHPFYNLDSVKVGDGTISPLLPAGF